MDYRSLPRPPHSTDQTQVIQKAVFFFFSLHWSHKKPCSTFSTYAIVLEFNSSILFFNLNWNWPLHTVKSRLSSPGKDFHIDAKKVFLQFNDIGYKRATSKTLRCHHVTKHLRSLVRAFMDFKGTICSFCELSRKRHSFTPRELWQATPLLCFSLFSSWPLPDLPV